jgi:hypothetical protein
VRRVKEKPSPTLADHAEQWTAEQGRIVPPRQTPEWDAMYREWHEFAFADFEVKECRKKSSSRNT